MKTAIATKGPYRCLLSIIAGVLIVLASVASANPVVSQETGGDCKEGYERLPGAKDCTPIDWDGPVIDPGVLETPGIEVPPPILVFPTPVPTLPDPTTPRADETPDAPTMVPRTLGSISISGFTCPRWHMPDYTNGLIPPCGPLPGITLSLFADGELIATESAKGSKDASVPPQITFAEVPAGKVLVQQEPVAGHEGIQVFCGKGSAVSSVDKWSVVMVIQPGEHLSCSFVSVSPK